MVMRAQKIVFVIHYPDDVDIPAQAELDLTNLKPVKRAAFHRVLECDILENWPRDRDP